MARCLLCDPPASMPDEEMYEHFLHVHDYDIAKEVEKWPDGEWVIVHKDPEPEDFT